MINTNAVRAASKHCTFSERALGRLPEPRAFEGIQDTFVPSSSIGLPDPDKYPDWRRARRPEIIGLADPSKYPRSKGETTFVPDYNKYPKDKPGIVGGWDAPMFYNGRVMTRREYAQLYGG